MEYVKLVNCVGGHPKIHNYTLGINEYNDFSPTDGMYFTYPKYIFNYIGVGSTVVIGEEINGYEPEYDPESMSEGSEEIPGFRFRKINIVCIQELNVEMMKYLLSIGADISANNYSIVKWSYRYNKEIYTYLHDQDPALIERIISEYYWFL